MRESSKRYGMELLGIGIERLRRRTTPYVIRGHHFPILADVIRNGSDRKALQLVDIIAASESPEYIMDVLGADYSNVESFEEAVGKYLSSFNKLPNWHPVRIVDNQRDDICKACSVGSHCNAAVMPHDGIAIYEFVNKAKSIGLGNKVKFDRRTATTSTRKDIALMNLRTTAGVVRAVVSAYGQ